MKASQDKAKVKICQDTNIMDIFLRKFYHERGIRLGLELLNGGKNTLDGL